MSSSSHLILLFACQFQLSLCAAVDQYNLMPSTASNAFRVETNTSGVITRGMCSAACGRNNNYNPAGLCNAFSYSHDKVCTTGLRQSNYQANSTDVEADLQIYATADPGMDLAIIINGWIPATFTQALNNTVFSIAGQVCANNSIPPLFPGNAYHTYYVYNGKTIFVMGGKNPTVVSNAAYKLDLSILPWTWTKLSPMLNKRTSFGVAEYQGKLYVFGGEARSSCCPATDAIEQYDMTRNVWTVVNATMDYAGRSNVIQIAPGDETVLVVSNGTTLRTFDLRTQEFVGPVLPVKASATGGMGTYFATRQQQPSLSVKLYAMVDSNVFWQLDVTSSDQVTPTWVKLGSPLPTSTFSYNNLFQFTPTKVAVVGFGKTSTIAYFDVDKETFVVGPEIPDYTPRSDVYDSSSALVSRAYLPAC